MKKKKPVLFLALEALLVAALLLPGRCQGSQGANLTVTGTVFCDACSSSSFSKHSYFLPDVKVRIDCAIRLSTTSKEEIKITAEKTTDSHGAYRLDIPAVAGLGCATGGEAASFCRAAVLDNPSPLCDVPAVTTTAGHISFSARDDPDACLYNLNSLYYRPGNKAGQCDGAGASTPAAAALNTSLFYCPHWPWPPIPFCTPRPWFPPIPFFTPPPPAFPFPFPPIPFFTPPSPPPPAFPFPLPPWPWTPPASPPPPSFQFFFSLICRRFSRRHLRRRPRRRRLHSRSLCRRFHSYLLFRIFRLCRRCIRHRLLRPRPRHRLRRLPFLGLSRHYHSSLQLQALRSHLLRLQSIIGKIQAPGPLPKPNHK